jgi:undecaprenyl-diphosphatase
MDRSATSRIPFAAADVESPLSLVHLLLAVHLTVPSHLTWLQALVVGFVQGITELFPISSLGHSVLIPELFGWHDLVQGQAASESFWLAFIVALHVANALALLLFFWRDWVRIIGGFFTSLAKRRAETSAERMAWLIIFGTIPVGIIGLALQNPVRSLLAKPMAAAVFLAINGVILLGAERLRRRSAAPLGAHSATARHRAPAGSADRPSDSSSDATLSRLPVREAVVIGTAQALALIPGISRDGTSMVAGLLRGLDHEDAAKFAFLLSTPVILAAGVLKVGDLTGPLGAGVRPQILGGAAVTFLASLVAVRFLSRYFREKNLTPFGIYCLVFGVFMVAFVAAGA